MTEYKSPFSRKPSLMSSVNGSPPCFCFHFWVPSLLFLPSLLTSLSLCLCISLSCPCLFLSLFLGVSSSLSPYCCLCVSYCLSLGPFLLLSTLSFCSPSGPEALFLLHAPFCEYLSALLPTSLSLSVSSLPLFVCMALCAPTLPTP